MNKLNLPGPKAKALIERDDKIVSRSYPRDYPFVMDRGKGTEVWDVDDNRFLDFAAGIAVVSTGHANPAIVKAIQDQAEDFIHISSDFYHEGWIRLSEKLGEIAPWSGPSKIFACNSGTEAVEAAIKLSRFYTKASQFVGFLGGFHGRTIGAVTFTASKAMYKNGFTPLMNGVVHVPFPNPYRPLLQRRPGMGHGETVVAYIEEEIIGRLIPPDDFAGILIEPIQGEGGYVVPPDDFFPALRTLCDKYGILLIADEVQSGMGRTGKWWAIENFGVEPDMITSAKGLASGMPLGALISKENVMSWPRGSHGNTYGGNPVACAASLATIDQIENGFLENTRLTGAHAKENLLELQKKHKSIGDVRGMGFMLGLEFVKDRESKAPAVELRDDVVHFAFERGLLLLGCGKSVIRITPPLSTSKQEVDEAMLILDESIRLAEEKHEIV